MSKKIFTIAAVLGGLIATESVATTWVVAGHGAPVIHGVTHGAVPEHPTRAVVFQTPHEPYQGHFYVGASFNINFLNLTNRFHLESDPTNVETDSYSFQQLMGFDLILGYQFAPRWRAEINYGMIGRFEDSATYSGLTFNHSLNTQYIMANVLYTLWEQGTTSIHAGAGLGAALVTSRMTGNVVTESNSNITYAGQLMLGVQERLTDNIAVVLQYRLMHNGGAELISAHTVPFVDTLVTRTSGMLNNSIQLGARVRF